MWQKWGLMKVKCDDLLKQLHYAQGKLCRLSVFHSPAAFSALVLKWAVSVNEPPLAQTIRSYSQRYHSDFSPPKLNWTEDFKNFAFPTGRTLRRLDFTVTNCRKIQTGPRNIHDDVSLPHPYYKISLLSFIYSFIFSNNYHNQKNKKILFIFWI